MGLRKLSVRAFSLGRKEQAIEISLQVLEMFLSVESLSSGSSLYYVWVIGNLLNTIMTHKSVLESIITSFGNLVPFFDELLDVSFLVNC